MKNALFHLREILRHMGYKITYTNYNLDRSWQSHRFVNTLRAIIPRFMPNGLYDPQDLEHQVLFRLTTFDPKAITVDVVEKIVDEQYKLINKRLDSTNLDLEYIFRGLTGRFKDLNIFRRLRIKKRDGHLFAKDDYGLEIPIEFKLLTDETIISFFLDKLHYIHAPRTDGDTWGFFFEGDDIPWAVKAVEPSVAVKPYKREALHRHGIHPDKAFEITRYYTLPGSPINSISTTNAKLIEYYKEQGMEAITTTTMPMYSKTKSSTIAGGLTEILLIKDTIHRFIPIEYKGEILYQHVTGTYLSENPRIEGVLRNHPNFELLPTVEVYTPITERSFMPFEELHDKVIYITNRY